MKTHNILFIALMVLPLSFAACGSDDPDTPQPPPPITGPPAQSVDLGIRVVNNVAADGTVTTLTIGRADNADFMAAYPTAKPLYFATGNLFVNETTGTGRIGTATEIGSGLNGGLFSWADPTGAKTSMDNNDYPSADFSVGISGNPTYDIARAKLGGKWRLPTSREFAFLLGFVAQGSTITTWSANNSYYYGEHSLWQTSPAGVTLASTVVGFTANSIFLPATGAREGNNISGQQFGYYWLGTERRAPDAYALSITDVNNVGHWGVIAYYRYYGLSVRPVMSE